MIRKLAAIAFVLTALFSGCSSVTWSNSERVWSEDGTDLTVLFTHAELGASTFSSIVLLDFASNLDEEMSDSAGVINHTVRKDLMTKDVWSRGVWRTESAAMNYIASNYHWRSIQKVGGANSKITYAILPMRSGELIPSWADAELCLAGQRNPRIERLANGADVYHCL